MSETKPVCPRCKRLILPWPLKRPNNCGQDANTHCIRNDDIPEVRATMRASEARRWYNELRQAREADAPAQGR